MSSTHRNTVLLFADVCGIVPLFERLSDSEALYAIDRCLKRMGRSIDGYSGKIVETGGKEMLVTFSAAEDACLAAIDMQQRVADLPPMSGLKLGIRIGLHSGEIQQIGDQLRGSAIGTAARVVGSANADQIICSGKVLQDLTPLSPVSTHPFGEGQTVREEGRELNLHQVYWPPLAHPSDPLTATRLTDLPTFNNDASDLGRFCIRYQGKAFLLDEKSPILSIGRDVSNELFVEDKRASRLHGRIERREDGYVLVDTSTNGTFVSQAGQRELMLRRNEYLLPQRGKLSFGASTSDANSIIAEFEHL